MANISTKYDGTLSLFMTQKQKEFSKELFNNNLQEQIKDKQNIGIEIKVSEKYDSVEYALPSDTLLGETMEAIQVINSYVIILQLFDTEDEWEWHVNEKIY